MTTPEQVKNTIGQLEASIDKVEPLLSEEDFRDYCDSMYTCISHLRQVLRKLKYEVKINEDFLNLEQNG